MAEEAIPSAADPLQSRVSPTRLPSLAELYAAQHLGQSLQSNSYTLPELYALEQTGAPLDVAPLSNDSAPQQSQSPAPQDQFLPILVDQRGAPLQPEPLTPGERTGGAARAAVEGATGDLSDYLEALARTGLGWEPNSTRAARAADEAFHNSTAGKIPNQDTATFDDHLADIQAASQRFSNAYPAQATLARGIGIAAPVLAGVGTTNLLARFLWGERVIGEAAARAAPQMVAPLARQLGPELAEGAAPGAARVLAEAEPAAEAGVAPEAIARPSAKPDGRYYSAMYETELKPKLEGTGRPGHNREANENLLQDKERYPDFAQMLENGGVYLKRTPTGLAPDRPPPGWTWHHVTERKVILHLMPRWQHEADVFQKVLHPLPRGGGGYSVWGPEYVQIPGASTGAMWYLHHRDAEPGDSAEKRPN
jgi:hypothetical protein